jgi:1-deoxy-D-xylulose-5-phosphate synthase
MTILSKINYPEDIKTLNQEQLYQLASEIRGFLVESVSKTGGHLAPNLGVVELTLALHRVFDMPKDKIIWDVGHQIYVHKLLTGRKDKFNTLRKSGGISGFPRPNESIYDVFSTGHSSTSISAALGIARARDVKKEKYSVIAVIGDGALTGGMALEALNDAGNSNTNITVVLNDNEMSISKNVGGLSAYLSKLRTTPAYINIRNDIEYIIKKIPAVGNNLYKTAERIKEGVKQLVVDGMLFEELGFTYIGPINGHDIQEVEDVLKRTKKIKGPVLIHVITKKGKGYRFAETKPDVFHGIGPFEVRTGESVGTSQISYSKVFGEEIVKEASINENIVAVTAAMPDGTGLKAFKNQFPKRFFDVGIAEQHAVTLSAGLAANGLKPVFAVYSTFLQRGYDQIVHDVCIQDLPVMFAIDRAGIVGEDGETHQGVFDISYLRMIPNITVVAPKDIKEFRTMLKWCFRFNRPVAIRYPRGGDYDVNFEKYTSISEGKWEVVMQGNDAIILAVGKMVQTSYLAAIKLKEMGINPTVVNCRFIKPLDMVMINEIAKDYNNVFIVEDNNISGGFGSAVLEHLSKVRYSGKTTLIGYPDEFITHGSNELIYKKYGLDVDGIYNNILKNL